MVVTTRKLCAAEHVQLTAWHGVLIQLRLHVGLMRTHDLALLVQPQTACTMTGDGVQDLLFRARLLCLTNDLSVLTFMLAGSFTIKITG
jgi:hypothetical protein